MGIYSWDLDGGFSSPPRVRTPRITIRIRCEYPDTPLDPTEVTFGLSPRYGIHTARESARLVPRGGSVRRRSVSIQ